MGLSRNDRSASLDPLAGGASLRHWMQAAHLTDGPQTGRCLEQWQATGIPYDLLGALWGRLATSLSLLDDADAGLAYLVRFVRASRSPHSIATLFERDQAALTVLLQAMSIGPAIAESMIDDPEGFELLRLTDGQPVLRQSLIDEIVSEVDIARDDAQVSKTLWRFRQREILRIAYGQWIRQVPAEESFRQLSYVAESILRAAFDRAYREVVSRCGQPMLPNGAAARCSVLALDRLGATQQGYDSALRLLILAETSGRTDAARIVANSDFYDRVAKAFVDFLSGPSLREEVYRIEVVRPRSLKSESLVVDAMAAFQHYDLRGRTWERQAFVSAQPIVGDVSLGTKFLQQLQPWIYRPYWNDADIAGLGACQRKLQRRLTIEAGSRNGVVNERGMAEAIEQMVLFLQLLHGHEAQSIRVGNTFDAIDRLAEKHFLRESERELLQTNYRVFRQAESHRFFRASSHQTTNDERKRMTEAAEQTILAINGRLEESFPDNQQTPVESDLVLDPQPEPSWVHGILAAHRFSHPNLAYRHLQQLSEENVAVLSTRRCRYYLSLIAPTLLRAIARTTDPDQTLANLAKVSESLGGKGILWELLSSSPATMDLIVRMCAYSSYLVGLITHSPGMIDELMDSLLFDRLPRQDELERTLAELCRGADDIDRVLRDFKNSMHLRVGVRDILGKESIVDTHRALSDIAEVCIRRLIDDEYHSLVLTFGAPAVSHDASISSAFSVVALGKLGGQEPNYHSDLSCVLLFDQDGVTQGKGSGKTSGTTVHHFYEQLAQRVMRRANRVGNYPRLYELDFRFGPLGKSGVLAMQLDQFLAYFRGGEGAAVERQSLCKARPIAGTPSFSHRVLQAMVELIRTSHLRREERTAILAYRKEMQNAASVRNLKRGEGGTYDIECLVQLLQLAHAAKSPEVLVPGTLEAIQQLERTGILPGEDARQIYEGYHFLREIEAGLRLMNTAARHDLPEELTELNRLAVLIGWESGEALRDRTNEIRANHRAIFEKYAARLDG